MASLNQIQTDLKQAMLSREEVKVSTLRMIVAAASNAKIAKGSDLSDEEITKIVQKESKQLDEAIEGANKLSRADLVSKNEAEKKVLAGYLPAQMDQAKLEEIIVATIHEIGAIAPSDMGKVMASVMPKLGGAADGAVVSRIVSQHLGS